MKEISTDYIKKVIEIMKNNELTEVALEDEDKSLVIKSSGFTPVIKSKSEPEEEEIKEETTEIIPPEEEKKKNLIPIVSNMIGLYFSRPNPNEAPFVKVGDSIKEGQVICIIETIKLINKITSEVSGKVAEICIEDGKPVEYGQVIMYIEKE